MEKSLGQFSHGINPEKKFSQNWNQIWGKKNHESNKKGKGKVSQTAYTIILNPLILKNRIEIKITK